MTQWYSNKRRSQPTAYAVHRKFLRQTHKTQKWFTKLSNYPHLVHIINAYERYSIVSNQPVRCDRELNGRWTEKKIVHNERSIDSPKRNDQTKIEKVGAVSPSTTLVICYNSRMSIMANERWSGTKKVYVKTNRKEEMEGWQMKRKTDFYLLL